MNSTLRIAAVGAALATLGISSSASAATASAQAQATILSALSVQARAGDNVMNFGTIAPGAAAGTLVLGFDGSATCSAGLTCVGVTNVPTFDITGSPNVPVAHTVSSTSVTLTSGTYTMTLDSFTKSGGATLTLAPGTGTASFTIGGTLHVGANQQAGAYTGQVNVEVNYS